MALFARPTLESDFYRSSEHSIKVDHLPLKQQLLLSKPL